jgi:hypothetical protein
MLEVKVSREVDQPLEKVWAAVADFGSVGWMQGIAKCEVEGEGVGMVRNIYVDPAGSPVREKLTGLDHDAHRLQYEINEGNPMPVDNYKAWVGVEATDGGCRIDWGSTFDAKGVDDAAAKASLEGMYGVLIGWLVDGLA